MRDFAPPKTMRDFAPPKGEKCNFTPTLRKSILITDV